MVGVLLGIVVLESAAQTCRQKSDWRSGRKRDDAHGIRDKSEKVKVKALKSHTRLSRIKRGGIYIRRSQQSHLNT